MNRIKELCFQKGIEQKELAILVGVSQPTVSDWFNNKKNPKGKRLEKLSEVLGVSRSVIMGYDEAPTSPDKIDEELRSAFSQITDPQTKEEVLAYIRFRLSEGKKQ